MKKALKVLRKVLAYAEWAVLMGAAVLLFFIFFNTLTTRRAPSQEAMDRETS